MRRVWLCFAVCLLYAGALGRDAFDRWVAATPIPALAIETSVEVHDQSGTLLRGYTVADGRWRLQVGIDQVDANYVDMLIAYEDKRYFRHHGVDLIATARAIWQRVRYGRVVSGASTLTMQVARLLEDGPTGTWAGKVRQTRLALALERRLSKQQILELYMNRAPFGGNLEGVRAATFAYFGKEPRRLTPAEAALLVALPQSPERRRPDRFYGNATSSRDRVLDRMRRANLLNQDTVAAARTERVPKTRKNFPALAPHLSDRITTEDPSSTVIVTTVSTDLQRQLELRAAQAAKDAGQLISIAILVADHQSGAILASVGSAAYRDDLRDGFVDMTQAVRSPGSTLKPLIYALAFDQGLAHPETLIEDRPVAFGSYAPQNFDGLYRGTLRVKHALQLSLNVPVVKLTAALGPARLMAHLRRAGLSPEIARGQPGLAIALGGVGLTLQDLVQLYAAMANEGRAVELSALRQIPTNQHKVLSPEAAWQIADILSDTPPPAGSAPLGIAYKTGTSYGYRDAWAVGFDGQHVIGVWMGRPDGTPVPGAFGGILAAPVLFDAFATLKPKIDRLPPPPPGTLLVSHAQLPAPLQHFRPRDAAFTDAVAAPKLAFPPDGAQIEQLDGKILVRVSDGVAPFSWLANGAPVVTGSHDASQLLSLGRRGFVQLTVIDALGRSARARIQVE